ncbi:Hypothetical protein A7982_07727 [Minicystis rosea]|nr:Hypothetical protein A7982_07727 [Minicystis rosea]
MRDALWPSAGRVAWHVYAMLDAARHEDIHPAVTTSGLDHACLYAGKLPKALSEVAPYLVRLTPDAPLTRDLLTRGWGDAWGTFVISTATLEELRRHFRRFLKVEDEAGQTMIFRFYDPRVLRAYLPTCTAGELSYVFGPVGMFVMEGEAPDEVIRFHREGQLPNG